MLASLNIGFFVFHTLLILFNITGWAWKPVRRWNLVTLFLTLVSWAVLGAWKGAGYCICTDWHWQVRRAMGIEDHADSYLVLLVRMMTGWDPPVRLVNTVALVAFGTSLALSAMLNLRDYRRRNVQ